MRYVDQLIEVFQQQERPDWAMADDDWGVRSPLGEQGINEAERQLGFALPGLLRRLYAEVGNGGFGPYYGFYPLLCEPGVTGTVKHYHRAIDPGGIEQGVPWQKGLLLAIDAGGGNVCVDCTTEDARLVSYASKSLSPLGVTLYDYLKRWVDEYER